MHQKENFLLNSPLGAAYYKIYYDDDGLPVDFITLQANDAFEKITGIPIDIAVGQKASKTDGQINARKENWLHFLDEVIRYGPKLHENYYSSGFDKWFLVDAWEEKESHVAVVLKDITQKKEQIDLSESNKSRFREVFDRVPHITFVIDVTPDQRFRVIDFNQAYLKHTGKSREELEGRYIEKIFPQDISDHVYSKYRQCVEQGEEIRYEEDLFFAGKTGDHYLTTLSPRKNKQGEVFQIIGSSIEINDLKKTQTDLQKSEEKYRSFIQNSTEGIYLFEFTKPCSIHLSSEKQVQHFYKYGYISSCNDSLAQMYGYENGEELIGKKLIDFHGSDSDPEHIKSLKKIVENGYKIENMISKDIDRDGNTKYFLDNVVGIVEDEKIVRLWASQQDITSQKLAEESLKKARSLQQKMVSNIGDVIVIIDKEGNNRYKSPNIEKHFGWTAEELVDDNTFNLIHPKHKQRAKDFIQHLIDNPNQKASQEMLYKHKNKGYRWIKFTGINMFDDPDIQGILGNYHDITFEKDAERELQENKELLSATLRSIGDGVISCDRNGNVVSINQVAEKLTGWSSGEASGIHIEKVFKIINSKTRKEAENPVQKALSEGVIVGLANHTILISKDGKEYQIADSCAPIKDSNNKILGCVLVFRDVTQEYQQREALQKSEQRFRALTYNVPGIIYLCNNDERYTMNFINDQVGEITGYTSEEFLEDKISFAELYHPEDAEWIPDKVDKALQKKEAFHLNYRIKHRNGDWRWVLEHGTGIYDEQGELLYLEGYLTDITEQKKAEQLAHKASQQLKFHINNSPLAVIISDDNFDAIQWSKSAEELFGWTEAEVLALQQDGWKFVPDEDYEKVEEKKKELLEGKASNNLSRNRNYTKDGRVLHCEWYNSVMVDQDGNIISIFSLVHDVSERKEKQEQLEESLAEKETLLAEIHHRVKNNLAVVSGMMQLQAFDTESEELQHKLYDSVIRIKSIASVHELLYQSNSFSRLDFSDTIIKLIENISETLQTSTSIQCDVHCEHIKLNINKAIPASLIVNEVVTNIYKHAFVNKDEGNIEFNVSQKDSHIHIEIKDNGVGLDESKIKNSNSLGMHLIDELTKQIEGEYQYSGTDSGTRFTLQFEKS